MEHPADDDFGPLTYTPHHEWRARPHTLTNRKAYSSMSPSQRVLTITCHVLSVCALDRPTVDANDLDA